MLEKFLGGEVVVRAEFAEMPQAALIGRPGVEVARRLAHRPLPLGIRNDRSNRDRHRFGDLVLQREDVGEIAVVPVGPDVVASLGFDQLGGDANAIGGPSHAAFEHVAHAEFAPDLLQIDCAALVGEGGVARDDEQRGVARQSGDDVFGDPVGDELLLGVAAHVRERQHGD